MKTYKEWQASKVDALEYLRPADEIDETMYDYFRDVIGPKYLLGYLLQHGEPMTKDRGRFLYMTFSGHNDKYYYLGMLPPFKQPKW